MGHLFPMNIPYLSIYLYIYNDLGKLQRPHCSPSLGIMIFIRGIIPIAGRTIQVSEIL
jgi:hypothetical protein